MPIGDQNTSNPINPDEQRVHDANYVLNELKRLVNRGQRAAIKGEAYRITPQPTTGADGFALDDGEAFTLRINPVEAGGTVHLQTPNIDPADKATVEIFENAAPDGTTDDTADDLFIHNQRYDEGQGNETPTATIQRITDGSLDTTGADQTEHRLLRSGRSYEDTPGERMFWRSVPITDDISIRVTDVSGGTANELDFSLVLFEGTIFPD